MRTMVRTICVVTLATAVSAGVMAQPFDKLRAAPSYVEAQQPQAPVPSAAPTVQAGDTRPIHIYIRSGLKSHGEGLHDYPQFSADWSKLLTDHGALVDGSFHFPSAQELASTDVMVMYKGDAGYMTATERAVLEDYLKRGGGLVSFHDTLCGDDPQWFSTIVGGAKKHGEQNFSAGAIKTTIVDKASPIMKGMSDFEIPDEAFFKMTWSQTPAIHVLATARDALVGRGGAADLDLRAHDLRRPAVSRVRLDAGTHLREFQEPADRGYDPARYRLGRPLSGRDARERHRARARRPRPGRAGWRWQIVSSRRVEEDL